MIFSIVFKQDLTNQERRNSLKSGGPQRYKKVNLYGKTNSYGEGIKSEEAMHGPPVPMPMLLTIQCFGKIKNIAKSNESNAGYNIYNIPQ